MNKNNSIENFNNFEFNSTIKELELSNSNKNFQERENNNLQNNFEINLFNLYNFVFILTDENLLIFYEQSSILNSNNSESLISENDKNNFLYNKNNHLLEIKLIPILEENNSNIEFGNANKNSNNLNKEFFTGISPTNKNNIKFKTTYKENKIDDLEEEKISVLCSNLITSGNIDNYSDNENDSTQRNFEYGNELFTENASSTDIFDNFYSFEQTIEELRSYINLVGISLSE